MELERLSIDEVLRDELDLSRFIQLSPSCLPENGEKAPIRLVDCFLEFLP